MPQNDECNYADDYQDDLIADKNDRKEDRAISEREVRTPDQQIALQEEGTESMVNTNGNEPRVARIKSQMTRETEAVKPKKDSSSKQPTKHNVAMSKRRYPPPTRSVSIRFIVTKIVRRRSNDDPTVPNTNKRDEVEVCTDTMDVEIGTLQEINCWTVEKRAL